MNQNELVAVVTGGNRGLGLETCRQLLEKNYQVVLTSRDAEKGIAAAKSLQSKKANLSYFPCDVTNTSTIADLAKFIQSKFGRLDVLVNNAGILPDNQTPGVFEETSLLETHLNLLQAAMDTNAYGVVRMCQHLVPLMKANQYGRIVNVSSQVGQLSTMESGLPAYRISKTALNAITIILADELKSSGILVNSVSPGWVKTDMGGKDATVSIKDGVEDILWLATLRSDGPTGQFFRHGKPIEW
jgi:NAD(P)-dependent dehydrogenase (short-subunit alcohol dehydrogenase family)